MILYFLKFSAVLGILILFYKIFLERESFHVYKRIYLLASVFLSLIIPLITFNQYIPSDAGVSGGMLLAGSENTSGSGLVHIFSEWETIALGVYLTGLTFFGIRFIKNLLNIIEAIHKNPKLKEQGFTYVLLHQLAQPHTFLKYIFLDGKSHRSEIIPDVVLKHEQAHAREYHTIDILFIEIIKIFMWFNPLIYKTSNLIKLNHEFLADKSVIDNGVEVSGYQELLIQYAAVGPHHALVNAFNYSEIKKRLTVMKSKSSKRAIRVRSIILIPLLSILVFGFSSREVIPVEMNSQQPELIDSNIQNSEMNIPIKQEQQSASREQMKEYDALAKKYNKVPMEKRVYKLEDLERMQYIYGLMSAKQKKSAEPLPEFPKPKVASKTIKSEKAARQQAEKKEYQAQIAEEKAVKLAKIEEMDAQTVMKNEALAEKEYHKAKLAKVKLEEQTKLAQIERKAEKRNSQQAKKEYQAAKIASAKAYKQSKTEKKVATEALKKIKLEQAQRRKEMAKMKMEHAQEIKLQREKMKEEKMKTAVERKKKIEELKLRKLEEKKEKKKKDNSEN